MLIFLNSNLLLKIIKFGLVGFSGLLIDFGVTYLAKEKIKINKYLANILGFSCAVINNFILNKMWTFNNNEKNFLGQFTTFLIISIIGLLINQFVLYVAHSKFKYSFYLSKAIGVLVVVFWNFAMNYLITFK